MSGSIEFSVDVSEAAGLGQPCQLAVTAHLPDPGRLGRPPVVCFAFPGGGYSRRYWSFDLPGATGGGQAGWHTSRGWVVIAVDHLGVGESTLPPGELLTYENIAAANVAVVAAVSARLADGTLAPDFPPVTGAVTLGIGQSMGGCLLLVAQGQHAPFDGIGVLGFSAIHTSVPSRPGSPPTPMPWMVRGGAPGAPVVLNAAALAGAAAVTDTASLETAAAAGENPFSWAFHFDDEPPDVVAEDMAGGSAGPPPPWRSATIPPCAIFMVTPGTVASEAAAINVPVLVAVGERDVVADPWLEPKAYRSCPDITVFVCPRMAHMHNFAGTRERLWARLQQWGEGVAALRPVAAPAPS